MDDGEADAGEGRKYLNRLDAGEDDRVRRFGCVTR
jgi:hypothetical protein